VKKTGKRILLTVKKVGETGFELYYKANLLATCSWLNYAKICSNFNVSSAYHFLEYFLA
jgi:hypothetical protein